MPNFQVGDRVEVIEMTSWFDGGDDSRTFATIIAVHTNGTVDARWDGLSDEQIAQSPRMRVYTYPVDRLRLAAEAAPVLPVEASITSAAARAAITRECAECGASALESALRCARCGSSDLIHVRIDSKAPTRLVDAVEMVVLRGQSVDLTVIESDSAAHGQHVQYELRMAGAASDRGIEANMTASQVAELVLDRNGYRADFARQRIIDVVAD